MIRIKDKTARNQNVILLKKIKAIEDGSLADVILQLEDAKDKIVSLEKSVSSLKSRVTSLENKKETGGK